MTIKDIDVWLMSLLQKVVECHYSCIMVFNWTRNVETVVLIFFLLLPLLYSFNNPLIKIVVFKRIKVIFHYL